MDINKIWKEYVDVRDEVGENDPRRINLRNTLLLYYMDIVKVVSSKQSSKIGYRYSADELESYGVEGLMKAIDSYDPSRNVKFKTFASIRVLGEILDFLRSNDFVPRSVRDRRKNIDTAIQENRDNGNNMTDMEVIQTCGFDYTKYIEDYRTYCPIGMLSIDSLSDKTESGDIINCIEDGRVKDVDHGILRKEFFAKIAGTGLTESEREIVNLHYYSGYGFCSIAKILDISVSTTISRHKSALSKMKDKVMRNPTFFKREIENYCH